MPDTARVSIETDLRRILWIQAVRAFLYGFGVVVLGTALKASGMSATAAGFVFTLMLAGMALAALTVGAIGDRVGRRRTYAMLLGALGLIGIVFALTDNFWVLAVAALTGTMSPDYNDNGPMTTLEQSMIAEAPSASRVRVFGRYNAVAYLAGALGALAVWVPEKVRQLFPSAPGDQRWLLIFPVGAAACVWLATRLSSNMELGANRSGGRPLQRSRRTVLQLASLFSIDSFAGGFVVNSVIVLWFTFRFGAGPRYLGVMIFAVGLLQAVSAILASSVADRIGLLNTMVFTHLPSNLLLILVALMPNLSLATVALLLRSCLSQMDVPTRQAYLAAMVDPQERTAAAGVTNTARYLSRPLGPVVGTALMQNVATGAPFVVAGAVKSAYDLLLWRVFKRVPLPDGEAG